jgi:predicted nucleic acid-binding protein
MSYLLDTNVLSELVRPKPNESLLHWFKSMPNEALYISTLTIGEIRKGIEGVKEESRREKIRLWLEIDLPEWFGERILSVDIFVADRWGRLQAEMKRPIPAIDSLIAATALHFDLRLVTRNEQDFQFHSLQVVNPWKRCM